jgi:hypothetical protein
MRLQILHKILPAATLLGLTVPALAQVQPGSPNAANESMARQSETRGLQQGITSQNNATRAEIQRSQTAPQAPPPGAGVVAPRR